MAIEISRRDIGALLILGLTVIVVYSAFTMTDPLNQDTLTLFVSVIGVSGAMYAGSPTNSKKKTLHLPKGVIRCFVVSLAFYSLLFAPGTGVRPLLFEIIAVAFGRSLKE